MKTGSKLHLIYVPFTGVGIHNGYRGDEWFAKRIEIFKRYTLASLEHSQTKKTGFVLWLSFRPEEEMKSLTYALASYLKDHKFQFVMTFDGIMYYDDKFAPGKIPLNFLRILRGWWRSGKIHLGEVRELFYNKNSTLVSRLARSLDRLKRNLPQYDWVYLTRIDSDDMFHKQALIEIINEEPVNGGALLYRNGYVIKDVPADLTYKIAKWEPKTNPPFHTIIFTSESFYSPVVHQAIYNGYKSHEDIPKLMAHKYLSDGMYAVGIHDSHISTLWDHPFRGKLVNPTKIHDFGLQNPPELHCHG